MHTQVGWMIATTDGKHAVIGKCCESQRTTEPDTPIFDVNIFPYNQHCIYCGSELVRGQSTIWPELFDGKLASPLAERNVITLHKSTKLGRIASIMATYTGPHQAKIIRLFETDTIATSFSVSADPTRVLEAIKALNPGCIVRWA